MLNCETRGSGPDLVLLHPVGLDGSFWHAVAAEIPARRITLVDLPGHGRSAPLAAGAALEDFAGAVIETLGARNIPEYDLCGLSFGGMIAQTMAVRPDAHLRALILAGCPSTFPDDVRPAIKERGAIAVEEGMEAVLTETLERWFTADFIARGGAEDVRRSLLAEDAHVWAASWQAIAGLDTLSRLAAIKVPTLCIAGEVDLGSPPAAVRRIADAIPQSRYTVLPNAPHMMHVECPGPFAAAVSSFLDGIEAG